MRIKVSSVSIFAFFLFVNLVLLAAILYLGVLTQDNFISNITRDLRIVYMPLLNKDVRDIHVNSKAFIIYDPDARVIIAGKNEHFRFSPASSAKIMTAIIILEEYKLDQVLTASGVDQIEGSEMKLEEGEAMTVENLLFGLMLPSGNDAAYVMAANYNGGVNKFIERMNDTAKTLKLENTKFVDPSGYSDNNYTTAFDLARLASYALKNDKFREIVSTKNKTVSDVTGSITHDLNNLNELLGVEGVTGIKTGFTEEAGGVLVSSIEREGKTYVVVVLNSPDRFQDTKNIIINALKNISLVSY
jgi:D-alanyl-D-alanine carboxypeptidase